MPDRLRSVDRVPSEDTPVEAECGSAVVVRGYVVTKAGQQAGARVPVNESLVLGRTSECGVVVDDGAASRRHMEILRRGPKYYWRDLGSTNGTIVNGRRMLEGELRHGDLIQIGESRFIFEVEAEADAEASAVAESPPDATVFKETVLEGDREVVQTAPPSKAEYLLKAVYEVMNDIATNYEPCSLVDRILVTTMKAIDAQRGAVFFAGEPHLLQPCPVCNHIHVIENNRLRAADRDEIKISRSVVERVLQGGESVLYRDTGADGELNVSESIMSLKLRSIICVPLRGKTGVLGVLYIDSTRTNQQYSHDDMLLSTAVGNSAGLALENAQMHRQILEKQRIDQEIEHAWTIQEGFLVRDWPADDPRFEVYGEMRPAKTVGGDFYDFVRPDEHTVGILIGDVSGKGVPAALSMAQILAEFRLRALELSSPADVLRRLNSTFVTRSQRGIFCTLAYLRLDLRTGHVACANAGHHGAIRIRGTETKLCGEATGLPIGILEQGTWQDMAIDVHPGESFLLYTDGIVEARTASSTDPDAREYGVERVIALAQGWTDSPRTLLRHIMDDVSEFCAPHAPHDDCTMIALRYAGPR